MYVHIIKKCILKLLELIKYFLESIDIIQNNESAEYITLEQNRIEQNLIYIIIEYNRIEQQYRTIEQKSKYHYYLS